VSTDLLVTVIFLVSLILSGIALVQDQGRSILAWAVFLIALGLVILRVL